MDYVKDNQKYNDILKEASKATNINFYPHPEIDERTVKIDTEMAVAMTTGYLRDNDMLKTCIMSSHANSVVLQKDYRSDYVVYSENDTKLNISLKCFEVLPKLITHNIIGNTRGNTPVSGISDRPLSSHGVKVRNRVLDYKRMGLKPLEFKYIASLVAKYHIINTKEMWQEICTSGIFDIWTRDAPYNNIEGREDPLILLLRVYELEEEFTRIFDSPNYRYHELAGDMIREIKKPVIEDDEFLKIHENLDSILIRCHSVKSKELYIHCEIETNDIVHCVKKTHWNNFGNF